MYRICIRNVAGKTMVSPKRYDTKEKAQARLDSLRKEVAEIGKVINDSTVVDAWIVIEEE